jgi:hypothetical protein
MQGDFVPQHKNTKTLTRANGETLTVRKRLTAGERRAALERMSRPTADGRGARVNPLMIGLGNVIAFLVAWTVTDDTGAIVPIDPEQPDDMAATLDALDPDAFDEIRALIDDHETAMVLERLAAKKKTAGASALSATPSSPDTTDSVTPKSPS